MRYWHLCVFQPHQSLVFVCSSLHARSPQPLLAWSFPGSVPTFLPPARFLYYLTCGSRFTPSPSRALDISPFVRHLWYRFSLVVSMPVCVPYLPTLWTEVWLLFAALFRCIFSLKFCSPGDTGLRRLYLVVILSFLLPPFCTPHCFRRSSRAFLAGREALRRQSTRWSKGQERLRTSCLPTCRFSPRVCFKTKKFRPSGYF